jgi:hypothetical protein
VAYLLMDLDADLLGSYRTERAALRAIADDVRRLGRGAMLDLQLVREDRPPDRARIAEGAALLDRALDAA